jgi:hypothetical protein
VRLFLDDPEVRLARAEWTSSSGVEGLLRNPSTPGGWHGGEADPETVYS